MKQYSEACEQNRSPILGILEDEFSDSAPGTGNRQWHRDSMPFISAGTCRICNGKPATSRKTMPASGHGWRKPDSQMHYRHYCWTSAVKTGQQTQFDGVFSANTAHIMSWPAVESMFAGIGKRLDRQGRFCLYGPFNYGNQYTSPSNQSFDRWLKRPRRQEWLAELRRRWMNWPAMHGHNTAGRPRNAGQQQAAGLGEILSKLRLRALVHRSRAWPRPVSRPLSGLTFSLRSTMYLGNCSCIALPPASLQSYIP